MLAVAHQDLLTRAADRVYRLAGGHVSEIKRQDGVASLTAHG
jgi:hypothetical protein